MATLSGETVQSTFGLLLKVDSGGIDGTLRTIQDGDAGNSALKLSSGGISSTGTLAVGTTSTFTGVITASAGVTGDLTGNVTGNADTVTNGVYTTGSTMTGDILFNDGVEAKFGTGGDLEISHDGSNSIIADTGTGSLVLRATDFQLTNAGGTANMILAVDGGPCSLHHNGTSRLATTSTGITVIGAIAGDLTGDVTGDVSGDLTGDVTGDVTGNVTGNVTGGTFVGTVLAASGLQDGVTATTQSVDDDSTKVATTAYADSAAAAAPNIPSTTYLLADTTWTVPGGITKIKVTMVGAGGCGSIGFNGFCGAYLEKTLTVTPSASIAFYVGTCGSGHYVSGSSSYFAYGGTTYTASGGRYGGAFDDSSAAATNGDLNITGYGQFAYGQGAGVTRDNQNDIDYYVAGYYFGMGGYSGNPSGSLPGGAGAGGMIKIEY